MGRKFTLCHPDKLRKVSAKSDSLRWIAKDPVNNDIVPFIGVPRFFSILFNHSKLPVSLKGKG
jgi:hypothetical protein